MVKNLENSFENFFDMFKLFLILVYKNSIYFIIITHVQIKNEVRQEKELNELFKIRHVHLISTHSQQFKCDIPLL